MSRKEQWFEDKKESFAKLYSDVGQNKVKVYDIHDYSSKSQIEVHPKSFLGKCTHVEIAVSGEVPSGRDWMLIVPYRVDGDSGKKVYDADPVLTVLDSDSGMPSSSGVVARHRNFPERTTELLGYEHGTIEDTVKDLRQKLTTGVEPLASGSQTLLNALSYMHNKYKDQFGS